MWVVRGSLCFLKIKLLLVFGKQIIFSGLAVSQKKTNLCVASQVNKFLVGAFELKEGRTSLNSRGNVGVF